MRERLHRQWGRGIYERMHGVCTEESQSTIPWRQRFFDGALLDYLESVSSGYLIKVKLKNPIAVLEGQEWKLVKGCPGWEQADFQYQCATWSRHRRFVSARQLVRIERGLFDVPVYEYFCYVTTEHVSPMEAHRCYGERAPVKRGEKRVQAR